MQKFKQVALPLVSFDEDKNYNIGQQAIEMIRSLTGKIAIVSVAGLYRTGKSYLLNRMLLNRGSGFGVASTIMACTKGIWVWGKPLIQKIGDQVVNVLIIDSEGLGSLNEQSNHDAKIFALTLLFSSHFIYNSVGSIDQNTLAGLGLIVNLSKHLKTSSTSEDITNVEQFPHLFWVVRDFSLQLVNKNGQQISQKQYLENTLQIQPGAADIDGRNQVRKAITKYFSERDCVTLVRPLTNQNQLQNLDKMDLDLLKPQFVEQMLNFRKNIMSSLKAKTLCGKYLNGVTFSEMVYSFVSTINEGGIPTIENTWKYVCQQQSLRAFEQCIQHFDYHIHEQIKRKIPLPKITFLKETNEIKTQTKELFFKIVGQNYESKQYLEELIQRMDSKIELLRSDNKIENVKAAQEFASNEFESIDRKIRNGEYKRIGQLIKQIQLFQEYYKKKCPYQQPQAQAAITDFLFRKLCQGALSISKQQSLQQIEAVKQKTKQIEQKHHQQLQQYKEKIGRQKNDLNDKIALADKLKQQLQIKIDVLNEEVQKYRYNLQDAVKQKESIQTIHRKQSAKSANDLRTLVTKLQRQLQDCKIQKNERLSGQDRQILLLKNKVEHYEKNNQQIHNKYKESETALKDMKEQNQKAIKDLENKYETSKSVLNCKVRNLDSLLEQRINQLAMSQAQKCVLQSRIQDLEQRNKTLKDHSEQNLRQIKQQMLLQKETQIQKIHKQFNNTSSDLANKIRRLQNEIIQKQSLNKQIKLEFEKQIALLNQKTQFLQTGSIEKDNTIEKLNAEYSLIMMIVQSKDDQISQLQSELRANDEQSSKGSIILQHELSMLRDNLTSKNNQTTDLNHQIQNLFENLKSLQVQNDALKEQQSKTTQQMKLVDNLRKQTLIEQQVRLQQQIKKITAQFELQKQQQKQRNDELLKNNEKTLIQLKNFYEMEKQRNQKKLLQETQKVTALENETVAMLRNEYQQLHKSSEEEIDKLSIQLRDTLIKLKDSQQRLQRSLLKSQSVFDQELNQKAELISQLKKKQTLNKDQTKKLQKQLQDQRVLFLKKVQNITFQMSRKQKQILQLTSKKQNNEQLIAKKDQILNELRREYDQEMKLANEKIDELKSKLQTLKDQHIELKIQSEKQLALSKQKNEFLSSKVTELIKERELLSSKNLIQKPQVDKNQLLKQQYQKAEQQIASLEGKLQKARKAVRQGQSNLSKQLSQIQKQKLQLQQKLIASEDKLKELNSKLNLKAEQYQRQVDELKQRLSMGQSSLSSEYDKMKQDIYKKSNEITQLQSKLQRQTSLLEQKIRFIQNQKQQLRKELQESRKKLQFMMNQLQKGRKPQEDDQRKQLQNQKKLNSQLDILKQSLKRKAQQAEQNQLKYKTQLKLMRDKNTQLQERLIKNQKMHKINELLTEQNEKLKKQRDEAFFTHKIELSKQSQQNRKKVADLEKKYKTAQKRNAQQTFTHQKQRAKWNMQKDTLNDKVSELEDRLKKQPSSLLDKKSADKYKHFTTNHQMMKSMPYFDRKQ